MTCFEKTSGGVTALNEYVCLATSIVVADRGSLSTQPSSSTFMRLPAELRNLIYYYAIGGNTWLIRGSRAGACVGDTNKHALALLRVSRQIHSEASLLPYIHNTFEGRHDGHLKDWLGGLPIRHRKAVVSVKRHQRGYVVQGAQGLEVSPTFWMATPNMGGWGLDGLKRIEIEVVLSSWRWDSDREKVSEARNCALGKLRRLVEEQHPGAQLVIT